MYGLSNVVTVAAYAHKTDKGYELSAEYLTSCTCFPLDEEGRKYHKDMLDETISGIELVKIERRYTIKLRKIQYDTGRNELPEEYYQVVSIELVGEPCINCGKEIQEEVVEDCDYCKECSLLLYKEFNLV